MTDPAPAPEPSAPRRAAELAQLGLLGMQSEREDDIHTISLFGELDIATADAVNRELERVEAGDVASIILDLSGLTFMDSTGIRIVIMANGRSRESGHRLALLRGPAAVQRVFELSGVDGLLPFADQRPTI